MQGMVVQEEECGEEGRKEPVETVSGTLYAPRSLNSFLGGKWGWIVVG